MRKILVFLLLLYSIKPFCQTGISPVSPGIINVGGGTFATNNTFSIDWSIGESTLIETYFGNNGFSNGPVLGNWSVTSGLLQPFDNKNIIYNNLLTTWSPGEIRLFPVPTPNKIFIDFRSVNTGKIVIQLLGNDGILHSKMEFDHAGGNSVRSWDLSNRPSGIYMFKILLLNNLGAILKQGTFQITKIN